MIYAKAQLKARQTFGAVGYFQVHTLENIERFIKAGIEYSVLTSQGFKHIEILRHIPQELAYNLIYTIADGKKREITILESQQFYDFNKDRIVTTQELIPDESGILLNVSTDLRCSGVNIKLQVAHIIAVDIMKEPQDAYEIKLAIENPKVYIDDLETIL